MFEFSNLKVAYFSAFLCKICVTAECKVGGLSQFVWYSKFQTLELHLHPLLSAHPSYAY